jgi:tRNA dimethylallyltransferase
MSVLVLVGPTASGKTAVAMHLARQLGGEIISADSRQMYRHLDIGTAKPTPEQRAEVPHHFVDMLPPDQDYNAGRFGEEGRRVIDEIFSRSRTPIVVGGSGLYVQALIDGLFDGPGADPEFRHALEERVRADGLPAVIEELRRVDPVSAARIDPTKPRRIVRALEVYHATGRPLSEHHAATPPVISFMPLMFGLLWERKDLYARIDLRCAHMLDDGLLREAEDLDRRGYPSTLNALNTVGYREAFSFLRGELGREEMLRLFRRNTRRYAKRQMTWFRRDGRIRWIAMNGRSTAGEIAAGIARAFRTAS